MRRGEKIGLFICLFAITCFKVKAQNNLVPNWSFENTISCPNYIKNGSTAGDTTIRYTLPWQNGNFGTVDIFEPCDTFIMPGGWNRPKDGVPLNAVGYQLPHTGNNYAGIIVYPNPVSGQHYPPLREYPQVKLIDSLKSSKKYCVSFYVSLADSTSYYSTSRMGCYISKNKIGDDTTHLLNVIPQIENPYHNYLNNYTSWTEIHGIYTAGGGENYITIGNFYSDANTDTLPIHINRYAEVTYYYVDDVSLVEYNTAYAGSDTTICKGTYANIGDTIGASFGAVYNWSVLHGDSSSILYSTSLANTFAKPKKTTTYVLQKQQCGIFSYDTIRVKIPASYTANAGRDTTICIGDTATIGTNNCNWCNYSWQNVSTNAPVISVYPMATTTYTLHLKDSCNTTSSLITVTVDYCQSPVVVVPNIFTPNGDDINDSWQITVSSGQLSIINYQCTIYDRWGIKVFETTNHATGFDGHSTSGLTASEGTYFYVLTYTDGKTNENKMLKGFLELVR